MKPVNLLLQTLTLTGLLFSNLLYAGTQANEQCPSPAKDETRPEVLTQWVFDHERELKEKGCWRQHPLNGVDGAVSMTVRRGRQQSLLSIRPVGHIGDEGIDALGLLERAVDPEGFAQEPPVGEGEYIHLVRRRPVSEQEVIRKACPVRTGQVYWSQDMTGVSY